MADTNMNAAIKLALEDQVTPALDKIDSRLGTLEDHFKKLEDSGTKANKNIGDSADKSLASIVAMGTSAVAVGELLKDAFEKGVQGLKQIADWTAQAARSGVDYNDVVDKLNVGFAALITNSQVWTDSQGKVVTGTVAYNAASDVSVEIMNQLRDASLKYGLDLGSMGKALELNTAKFSLSKVALNDQAKLLIDLALAGKTAGISIDNLSQQVMAFLNGTAGARNKLGAVLGFTPEEVKQAEQSIGGLFALVESKMPSIIASVDKINSTWSEGLNLVKINLNSLLGTSFKPLSDSMGQFTKDAIKYLNDPELKKAAADIGSNIANSVNNSKPALESMAGLVVLAMQDLSRLMDVGGKGASFIAQTIMSIPGAWLSQLGTSLGILQYLVDKWNGTVKTDLSNTGLATGFAAGMNGPIATPSPKLAPDTQAGIEEIRLLQQQNALLAEQDPLLKALLKAQQDYDNASIKTSKDVNANLISAAQGQKEYALQSIKLGLEISQAREEQAKKDNKLTEAYWTARLKAEEEGSHQVVAFENATDKEIDKLAKEAATSTLDIIKQKYDNQLAAMAEYDKKAQEQAKKMTGDQIDQQPGSPTFGLLLQPMGPETDAQIAERTRLNTELAKLYVQDQATKTAIEAKKALDVKTETDLELQNWSAYYNDLIDKAQKANGTIAVSNEQLQQIMTTVAQKAYGNAVTMEQGIQAGWLKIVASMKTEGQSMADFMVSVWDSMGTAFQTGFYDLLTGKISDLGNVLKTFWNSILQDFSKMLADMAKKAVMTGLFGGDGQTGIFSNILGTGTTGLSSSSNTGAAGTGTTGLSSFSNTGAAALNGSAVALNGAANNLNMAANSIRSGSSSPSITGDQTKNAQGQTTNQTYGTSPLGSGYSTEGGSTYNSQGQVVGPTGRPVDQYGNEQGLTGGQKAGIATGAIAIGSWVANDLSSNKESYTIAGQNYSGNFGTNKISEASVISTALAVLVVAGWNPVGIIAAAVVFVVGTILSLLSGPKEINIPLYTSDMKDPNSAIGNAMWQDYGHVMGSLMTTNTLGGGSSTDFSKYMNANLPGTESWQTGLYAASGDDITKNADTFFKYVLPKINIEQAFGQNWSGQYYSRTPSGQAGDPRHGSGISGVPIMDPGSFDPNAPIPKMLEGLGMTAKEIHGIALQIDLQDPDVFLTWLQGIVGVVASFHTIIGSLSGGVAGVEAVTKLSAQYGGYNPLNILSQGVISNAENLSNSLGMNGGSTVNADQIKQAQDLITLSNTYYNNCVTALNALLAMMDSINSAASTFQTNATTYQLTTDQITSARLDRLGLGNGPGNYTGELNAAQTTTDVQNTWNGFMKDANDQLNALVTIYNQVDASLTAMKATAVEFDNIAATAARNTGDLGTVMGDFTDLQTLIGTTGAMQNKNGTDYLTNLGLIQQGTQAWYSEALAFLQAVSGAQTSLTTGTQADIWQNNYKIAGNDSRNLPVDMKDNAQIGMLQAKITQDMGFISSATDPSTVTQYAGEIRSLLGTYEGFYKSGDAGYDGAMNWATGIEQQLEGLGSAVLSGGTYGGVTYAGLGKTVSDAAKTMGTGGESMMTAQQLFQTALDTAATSITTLNAAVQAFTGSVNTKLAGWATDIQTDMQKASDALTTAMNNFTAALGGDSSTSTTAGTPPPKGGPIKPITDLATSSGDSATALDTFTAAVSNATAALGG